MIMGQKFFIFSVLMFTQGLFVLGCSQPKESGGLLTKIEPSENSNPIHYVSGTSADQMIADAGVTCSPVDYLSCSPSVGMLVAKVDSDKVSQCTAFLVGPDIAMTNSHCIPESLKPAGSSCFGRIKLKFPNTGSFGEEEVDCASVTVASSLPKETKASPDYAVIRLAKAVSRPYFTINRSGFMNKENLKIFKVDPVGGQGQVYGMLSSSDCVAVHGTLVLLNSDSDLSSNMTIGDCKIIHGNSGSPLVDSHGQVRGVIQIVVDPAGLNFFLAKSKFIFSGPPRPLGIGTNFACLQLPLTTLTPPLPSECSEILSKEQKGSAAAVDEEKQIQAIFHKNSQEVIRAFKWDVTQYNVPGTKTSKNTFVGIPTCISDINYLSNLKNHNIPNTKDIEIKFNLPKLDTLIELDSYLVPKIKIENLTEIPVTLRYGLQDLKDKKTSQFEIYQTDDSDPKPRSLSVTNLKMCPARN